MALKLPRLDRTVAIADEENKPSLAFHQWWQAVVKAIETAFSNLEDLVIDIQAALEAADIAIQAADDAQQAANTAQQAADDAQQAVDQTNNSASLVESFVSGITIQATDAGADANINISSHTRHYGNGTTVSVNSGNISGLAYDTLYYIYYDDPSRAGGAVTYQSTTSGETAAQIGNRHTVGSVVTPSAAAPPTDGRYVAPPGVGNLQEP